MKQPSRMIFSFVYCLLSIVYFLLSIVYCLLSTVYCQLSTVYYLLSTVYCLISTVYCLLQCCQAENQIKISQNQTFYQTICLPNIRPKADPNWLFWGQNQAVPKTKFLHLANQLLFWTHFIFKEIFKHFMLCVEGLKSENQTFWTF